MAYKILILAVLVLSTNGFATQKNRSTSFSNLEGEFGDPITSQQLQNSLEIRGEVFLLDPSGKRVLYQHPQWRKWKSRSGNAPIESNWGLESDKHAPLNLHHTWTVNSKGEVEVLIEQFETMEPVPGPGGKVEYGKLLKRKRFTLKDFAAIQWISANENKNRLVVRLTPSIRKDEQAQPIGEMPISGREMTVTDSKGSVWTERVSAQSKYVAVVTHKGALLLSYYPFKGSSELGVARGNRMELKLGDGNTVTVSSLSDFLPQGVPTSVHGQYRPNLKTAHLGSTKVHTSSREDEFLDHIEK